MLPLVFLALLFFVLVVFWAALDNGFVDWDDNGYVLNNPMIRSLAPSHLFDMLTTLDRFYWQPVTWLSHAIDYQLFGLNPAGHHFISIVLHGINAFLFFLLIQYFVDRAYPDLKGRYVTIFLSAWVALLFAVHPLRVESVVWAAERKDLLCALFSFSAVLAYLRYVEAVDAAERTRWHRRVLVLFLLALMSKPMAVTLPIVLLLLDGYPLNRIQGLSGIWQRVREKASHFVMSFAAGVITIIAQKSQGAVVAVGELSVPTRLVNALRSSVFYIEKTLWPQPLVPLYPFPDWDWKLWLEVATFFVICWFCFVKWREGRRYWATVWMIYLVTLAPVIGIVQVGGQAAADRFTYIPTLGFYILLAVGMVGLWRHCVERKREVLVSVIIGYTAILTVGVSSVWTIQQIPVWQNTGVFWEWVIQNFPNKLARAHTNLGIYYGEQGDSGRAAKMYRRAIEIKSDFAPPYNLLAGVHQSRGEWNKAEELMRQALAIQPDAMIENNLGLMFMGQGNLAEAERWFHQAAATQADFAQAYNNLGLLYEKLERPEDAEGQYRKAIDIDFDLAPAHANLGNLYRKRNQMDRAIVEFNLAVFLNPEHAGMRNALAETLMAAGYLEKAEQELREVLRLDPGHEAARTNLKTVQQHTGSPT